MGEEEARVGREEEEEEEVEEVVVVMVVVAVVVVMVEVVEEGGEVAARRGGGAAAVAAREPIPRERPTAATKLSSQAQRSRLACSRGFPSRGLEESSRRMRCSTPDAPPSSSSCSTSSPTSPANASTPTTRAHCLARLTLADTSTSLLCLPRRRLPKRLRRPSRARN